MQSRIIFLILTLIIICTSCDPALRFQVVNTSEAKAQIIWELDSNKKETFWHFEPMFHQDSLQKTEALNINDTVTYDFSIGTWEVNNNLDSLVSCVKSLTIKGSKSTIIYTGKKQIKPFLENSLEGRYNSLIQITLE